MLIYDQVGQHTYTVEQMGVVYLASGTFTDWLVLFLSQTQLLIKATFQ